MTTTRSTTEGTEMKASLHYRGLTVKEVLIEGISDESDEQIFDLALASQNETRSRLFDMRVARNTEDPSRALVTLYTG
jgi:hypothetical protein